MSFAESYVSVHVDNSVAKKAPSRRSELEIKMDVLEAVSRGIDRPTQIMYKANLSWGTLQSNLSALVGRGFLESQDLGPRKRYELTQAGFEILQGFRKVVERMTASPETKSAPLY